MKNVIKLLAKGALVMLPMLVIYIYIWVSPMAFMDEEIPHYLWNKEKTNTPEDRYYDTIILGDSIANAAYMPEILSETTINLSLGGMTPVENYYILQDWLSSHSAPKVCYISFQDAHFLVDDCFWSRTMYTHRFRREQIREIIRTAEVYREHSILTEHYWMDVLSYELRLPNKYMASLLNGGFNQRYETNKEEQRLDELHGGRYIARDAKGFDGGHKVVLDEFYVNPLFEDYYRRLIGLCVDQGIQVRLVKLPHPENVSFTEEYRTQFYEYYEILKQDYPGITVDWIPTYQKECFVDENHLSNYGALCFSSEIRKLYPEDFPDAPLNEQQVAAVNDSISYVRRGEELFDWIAGRDYTLFLRDDEGVSSVSGLGDSGVQEEGYVLENGLFLKREPNEAWKWGEPEMGEVTIVVVDHYNDQVVYQQSFWREKDMYLIAE